MRKKALTSHYSAHHWPWKEASRPLAVQSPHLMRTVFIHVMYLLLLVLFFRLKLNTETRGSR
jgi:hypothetical protein